MSETTNSVSTNETAHLLREKMRAVTKALGEERAGRGGREATDAALVHLNAALLREVLGA